MFGYEYYIKINVNNDVIDSYTTGFRQPEIGDLKIASNQSERCWQLDIIDQKTGEYKYKKNGLTYIAKTQAEMELSQIYLDRKEQQEIEILIQTRERDLAIADLIKDKMIEWKDGKLKKVK